MTLSNSADIQKDQIPEEKKLSSEAQARVDATVNAALKILESTPDMKEKLQTMFDAMVNKNLRDPENIKKIQDGLFTSHEERIKDLNHEQKKIANDNFTNFLEKFSHNLAYMHRDINWDNEINAIKEQYEQKKNSVQSQYATIIHDDHPTQTA